VGLSAMRTMERFHISSPVYQPATKPLFSSSERNFSLKRRLTLFDACGQCLASCYWRYAGVRMPKACAKNPYL
jgi:hypothetical protein